MNKNKKIFFDKIFINLKNKNHPKTELTVLKGGLYNLRFRFILEKLDLGYQ